MKLYIVIDDEASPKDAVYSIHLKKDDAKLSENEFKEMVVGGRCTTIIEEKFTDIEDFVENEMCGDGNGRFLIDAEKLLSFLNGG